MNTLTPEVCYAEDASQCPAILDRIRRMNDALTRQDLDDAVIAYGLLKTLVIAVIVVATFYLIGKLIKRNKNR